MKLTWSLIAEHASITIATTFCHVAPDNILATCQVSLRSCTVQVGKPANVTRDAVPILVISEGYTPGVASLFAENVCIVVVEPVRANVAPVSHELDLNTAVGRVSNGLHGYMIPWNDENSIYNASPLLRFNPSPCVGLCFLRFTVHNVCYLSPFTISSFLLIFSCL